MDNDHSWETYHSEESDSDTYYGSDLSEEDSDYETTDSDRCQMKLFEYDSKIHFTSGKTSNGEPDSVIICDLKPDMWSVVDETEINKSEKIRRIFPNHLIRAESCEGVILRKLLAKIPDVELEQLVLLKKGQNPEYIKVMTELGDVIIKAQKREPGTSNIDFLQSFTNKMKKYIEERYGEDTFSMFIFN